MYGMYGVMLYLQHVQSIGVLGYVFDILMSGVGGLGSQVILLQCMLVVYDLCGERGGQSIHAIVTLTMRYIKLSVCVCVGGWVSGNMSQV